MKLNLLTVCALHVFLNQLWRNLNAEIWMPEFEYRKQRCSVVIPSCYRCCVIVAVQPIFEPKPWISTSNNCFQFWNVSFYSKRRKKGNFPWRVQTLPKPRPIQTNASIGKNSKTGQKTRIRAPMHPSSDIKHRVPDRRDRRKNRTLRKNRKNQSKLHFPRRLRRQKTCSTPRKADTSEATGHLQTGATFPQRNIFLLFKFVRPEKARLGRRVDQRCF